MGEENVYGIEPLFERDVRTLKHCAYLDIEPLSAMRTLIHSTEPTKRGE